MVSIILPTYNGEKYIRESIQSILVQTYCDWELIIIDDCSTDSTNNIVSEYVRKDERIRLFKNETNLKLPASLNLGFSKARGKYFTWTSDDNLYHPDALEKLFQTLLKNESCGLAFSRMEYIDANGNQIGLSYIPKSVEELYYHNIVGASFMYTREVYEKIGDYDTHKFLMEDYDYWLRILKNYTVTYIPDVLYQYRQHENSLTETRNQQVLQGKVQLLEDELKLINFGSDTLRMIYKELAEALFSLNRYAEMNSYLNKMKKISQNMNDVRKEVRISHLIGPHLSSLMKILFKKKNRNKNG